MKIIEENLEEEMKQTIENVDFFNLCQNYRFANPGNQEEVIKAYKALIDYIDNYTTPVVQITTNFSPIVFVVGAIICFLFGFFLAYNLK